MTDTHSATPYMCGSIDIFMQQVGSYNADAVVHTGDIADYCVQSEFDTHLSAITVIDEPIYTVPGNHDEGPVGVGPYDYALYIDNINSFHFKFDIGIFRFLGTTTAAYLATTPNTKIPDEEMVWLLNELENLEGQTPVIFSHQGPPEILDSGTPSVDIVDMCTTYGVKLWINGHGHNNYSQYKPNSNLTVLTAPSPTEFGTPNNADGGFGLIYVYTNRIEIAYVRAKSPWDEIIDPVIYPQRFIYKVWG